MSRDDEWFSVIVNEDRELRWARFEGSTMRSCIEMYGPSSGGNKRKEKNTVPPEFLQSFQQVANSSEPIRGFLVRLDNQTSSTKSKERSISATSTKCEKMWFPENLHVLSTDDFKLEGDMPQKALDWQGYENMASDGVGSGNNLRPLLLARGAARSFPCPLLVVDLDLPAAAPPPPGGGGGGGGGGDDGGRGVRLLHLGARGEIEAVGWCGTRPRGRRDRRGGSVIGEIVEAVQASLDRREEAEEEGPAAPPGAPPAGLLGGQRRRRRPRNILVVAGSGGGGELRTALEARAALRPEDAGRRIFLTDNRLLHWGVKWAKDNFVGHFQLKQNSHSHSETERQRRRQEGEPKKKRKLRLSDPPAAKIENNNTTLSKRREESQKLAAALSLSNGTPTATGSYDSLGLVGQLVVKEFPPFGFFRGTVTECMPPHSDEMDRLVWYKVLYEDGESEDMYSFEVEELMDNANKFLAETNQLF